MKTQSILLAALGSVPSALAHTVFTNFYVDGTSQGDAIAIRLPTDPHTASYPIIDLQSKDLACNVGGTKGVPRVANVGDGSTLTFEIRSWPNDISKIRLDRGHYGPCAVYLKKVSSAVEDGAAGDGWFKLYDNGHSDGKWCTDRIIDDGGMLSVTLPKGLQGGAYLARPEILALHVAHQGEPQFYTGCAQINIESSGDLVPESTVSIPGYVQQGTPSMNWNIYYGNNNDDYPTPGPPVAKLVSGGSSASGGASAQTEGQKPGGCILESGPWCAVELPDYNDEASCWKSTENCWDQADACWKSAPVTGGSSCEIMAAKCEAQTNNCRSGSPSGPANKGKDLTPPKATIDVKNAHQGGNVQASPASQPEEPAAVEAVEVAPVEEPAVEAPAEVVEQAPAAPVVEEPSTPVDTPAAPAAPVVTPAPAPANGGRPICPAGYKCVYHTATEVQVHTVYHTVEASPRQRSRGLHNRRHAHHL